MERFTQGSKKGCMTNTSSRKLASLFETNFSYMTHQQPPAACLHHQLISFRVQQMGLPLFTSCVLITLAQLVARPSHAATSLLPSQLYWNSVLPNTAMPKALSDLVRPAEEGDGYNHNAYSPYATQGKLTTFYDNQYAKSSKDQVLEDPTQVLFFFDKDMHPGATMKYSLARNTTTRAAFLSREAADSTPFSSKALPEILNKFSVKPGSSEAHNMEDTIQICEGQVVNGEDRHCATSLESMVDFVTSKVGSNNNIQVVSTDVEKGATVLQNYTITDGMKKLADADDTAGKVMACHKLSYGYAVFYCHTFPKTRAYTVPLQGSDGTKAKAVAICHVDTSQWSPNHFALKLLKIKPGTVPVCHFLTEGDIAWVSNQKPT